jgi:hypothetical protein
MHPACIYVPESTQEGKKKKDEIAQYLPSRIF